MSRVDLLRYLDQYKVGTRLLFAGNLTRQPYFQGRTYRIGVYPGLSLAMLESVAEQLETFFGVNFEAGRQRTYND